MAAELNAQSHVNEYFQTHAAHWNDIYADDDVDVWSQVHRDRHLMALSWVDRLALPKGAHVLEVGCGAGRFAVDLARRGLHVVAIDPAVAMVHQARAHAEQAGLGADTLTVTPGDATALAFDDQTFDLVVALGVLPWLADPQQAVREMARVTRPGGHVLVTDDNLLRLHSLFDPWLNPGTAWLKRAAKSALASAGFYQPSGHTLGARLHSLHFTDAALRSAGLTKKRGATVGFGPFTIFRWPLLPEKSGVALYHRLQRLADQGVPVLRATGSQYVVLAQKPA
jgi:ubiquinone/menaquinone biosynthesis C-methylase UbiE